MSLINEIRNRELNNKKAKAYDDLVKKSDDQLLLDQSRLQGQQEGLAAALNNLGNIYTQPKYNKFNTPGTGIQANYNWDY